MKHELRPPILKPTELLFCLMIFFCGCSSSYTVGPAGKPKSEYSYLDLNEELKGRHVKIEMKNGRDVSAKEVELSDDSVSWLDANIAEQSKVATTQIKSIVITNHLVGALEGMGFGVLVGATAGIIIQSSGKPNAAGIYVPWEAVAGAGLVVGLIPGVIIGHSYEYEFSSKVQSDSLQNGK